MFHARIRTPHDAFHLIAEVTPYNLQTLRQHLRQSLREDGPLQMSVRIDAADERAFARYTSRWLPQLMEAGTQVEVDVSPPAGGAPAGGAPAITMVHGRPRPPAR